MNATQPSKQRAGLRSGCTCQVALWRLNRQGAASVNESRCTWRRKTRFVQRIPLRWPSTRMPLYGSLRSTRIHEGRCAACTAAQDIPPLVSEDKSTLRRAARTNAGGELMPKKLRRAAHSATSRRQPPRRSLARVARSPPRGVRRSPRIR